MPSLKRDATLADLQRYVADMEVERGFAHYDVDHQLLRLTEEVGELIRSIRKQQGKEIDPLATYTPVAGELADVMIFLFAIANRLGANLEDALRSKEAINETRTWVSTVPD